MRKITLLVFILLPIAAIQAQENDQDVSVITGVDAATFKDVIDSLDGEIIVDLRTPEELSMGRIPGAIVIDFFGPEFEPAIRALDKDKVYLLYCAGGGRSGETAAMMNQMGFKKVYDLKEGFNGWAKKKMPVEK